MHLTARTYVWLIAIAASGIAAQWAGGWPGEAWRVLAATLCIALVLEARHAFGQSPALERAAPAQARLGVPFRAEFTLANSQRLPQSALVVQPLSAALAGAHIVLAFEVPAGGAVSRAISATPRALGVQPWAPVHLRMRGCFGLAWWERQLALDGATTVVPDTLSLPERRAAGEGHGDISGRSGGAGLELLGLRDYVPGDPLRLIDWKATARSGRRCVRVFAAEQRLDILLVLDCGRRSALEAGPLSRLHHNVNIASRLAERALANRDPVGLLLFADCARDALRPAIGDAALSRLRGVLTRARSIDVEPAPLAAALAARQLLGARALIVVFTDLDVEERAGQWLQALSLLTPKHLPLLACLRDEALDRQRGAPAAGWRDPYDIVAALELEQLAAANQAQARRRGAHVVSARPAELDRAVLAAYAELRRRRRV